MNILVIGNGFDLAHDLPTRYWDFLMFIKAIREVGSFEKEKLQMNDTFNGLNNRIKIKINSGEFS